MKITSFSKRFYPFIIISVLLFHFTLNANEKAIFKAGEKISYDLYYNWGLLWIHAGNAHFNTLSTNYNNKPCYYFLATGKSLSSFDKFFIVRDTFVSIVDKENFLPQYHKRVVREDRYWAQDEYWFEEINDDENKVTTHCKRKNGSNIDTLTFNKNVTDLITAVYNIRHTEFEKLEKKEKVPFSIVIDDDDTQFNLSLTYLGKETIKLKNGKKYNCLKIKPQLIKGNVFEDENAMTLWITNDKNRIPIMIETKIRVGSLKVMLKEATNTKYPITSLIK